MSQKGKRMTPSEENVITTPEPETIETPRTQGPPHQTAPAPKHRRHTVLLFAGIALAVVAAVVYSGIHSRAAAESRLKQSEQKKRPSRAST
jgi:hypothetical protein